MRADYVIVGAGSAGCVLANRLTEDPGTRVVLIEAGGRDRNPLIHIPAGYMKLLDHPTLTWGFKAEADPGTAGRAIAYPRGRVLGGSSSINGMIYVRGQPEDFDHWAQFGNRGWSWDDVLPFFRKAENWEGKEDAVHGKGGPLFTAHGRDKPLLCRAAVEAGRQIGCEYRDDVNDLPRDAGDGIGWVQQTRGGRRRASAARSYLRPALRRPNLQVITGALVHRVLFDGSRAIGVEYSRGGNTQRVDVTGEVILAAGAIGSPHILQLSGVGDPEHLGRAGIDVHHELRGVGRNMQDHYLARVSCSVQGAPSLNQQSRGLGLAGQVLRYLATGNGILTYAASLVAASVKVLPESATPDVQALFAHGSYAPGVSRQLDTIPGMTCGMWQMRPLSRGYVEARSPRPQDQPNINPRYFSDETDRRAAVGGLRWIRKLFAAPALAKYVVAETVPGNVVQSDDELLDYVRQTGGTVFHATCTCKMGRDLLAVVDDRLRVHGLERLRVIDASVMPAVTSTNTNAPTIMIAEKGAAMVREDARAAAAA
ncbi:MAG TPA: GMC family oxidoreductase N-terminal domain-containing protein [Acetobacteraceae bacterium]|jgi:choline dehydrogenase|nr:GMC family oxidoreductase N-terminal domain-containing protein [Acetobacteraceae bacterium]